MNSRRRGPRRAFAFRTTLRRALSNMAATKRISGEWARFLRLASCDGRRPTGCQRTATRGALAVCVIRLASFVVRGTATGIRHGLQTRTPRSRLLHHRQCCNRPRPANNRICNSLRMGLGSSAPASAGHRQELARYPSPGRGPRHAQSASVDRTGYVLGRRFRRRQKTRARVPSQFLSPLTFLSGCTPDRYGFSNFPADNRPTRIGSTP